MSEDKLIGVSAEFHLERQARKSGGDRYEEDVPAGQLPIMGKVYINQSVSRKDGQPRQTLRITITV